MELVPYFLILTTLVVLSSQVEAVDPPDNTSGNNGNMANTGNNGNMAKTGNDGNTGRSSNTGNNGFMINTIPNGNTGSNGNNGNIASPGPNGNNRNFGLSSVTDRGRTGFFGAISRTIENAMKGAFLSLKASSQKIKKFACKVLCPLVCTDFFGDFVCLFRCRSLCGRQKRSIKEDVASAGHLTLLPNSFSVYDMNDDGVVSLKELAFAAGHNVTQEDVFEVFDMADKNGDKVLTSKELYEGPFVFEMDVSDDNYEFCEYRDYRKNRQSAQVIETTPEVKP